MKTVTSIILTFAALLSWGVARAVAEARVGAPAPHFSLKDQTGKTVSLEDFKGKVIVLEWMNPGCPFVQRHYREKTMTTLAEEYKDKGVVWLAINSTADASPEADKKWAEAHQVPYPILDDSRTTVGKEFGAKSTPDMFVISSEGKLLYEGAIDNDPEGNKGLARINYVKQALDEILASKDVSVPHTKSYGCGVHYAN